ncbi:unnamed protein product [Microthlaspi erraticum]|uniref:Uncharacterized protein n=1 Tax=Microthlaspi erraticum TaxID=1685480 RepID=A0A6D2K018_9BRAS|nr:unnamed protein product [Microthlaspi erraticum]
MWSWSQEHALGQAFLLSHGILQGAHLRVLSFNEVPHVDEEDRADLDQGLGWITFLAKGEKRMVTFRQLGDLVWVQLWRRYQVELQGEGTPKGLGYNR